MRIAFRLCLKDMRRWWPYLLVLELLIAARAILDILISLNPVWIEWNNYFPDRLIQFAYFIVFILTLQADPLEGDRQFWITRPISPGNLLAGKGLFALLTFQLPLLLSQSAAMIAVNLCSFGHFLLLCRNQLLMGSILAIIALLAAATKNLARFVLLAIGLWFAIQCIAAFGFLFIAANNSSLESWGRAEFIHSLYMAGPILIIALLLLCLQYLKRGMGKAALIFSLSLGLALVFIIISPNLFWYSAARYRARLAGVFRSESPVSVSVGPKHLQLIELKSGLYPFIMEIPLHISGIPDKHELVFEKMNIVAIAPDGSQWKSGWVGESVFFTPQLPHYRTIDANGDYTAQLQVSWLPLRSFRNANIRIQGKLAFRLIGPAAETIISSDRMAPVLDGDTRCGGIISSRGTVQPACIGTNLRRAFIPQISESSVARNSIWSFTLRDPVLLGASRNAVSQSSPPTISLRYEKAWFTATFVSPKALLAAGK